MTDTNVETVEIIKGKDGQFRWRAKAGNNEIVAVSEGYTRMRDALKASWDTFPEPDGVRELVDE